MRRKTKKPIDASYDVSENQSFEVDIATHGDVCLKIEDRHTGIQHVYRCSRDVLRQSSEYFDVLFDPFKFSEGIAIEAQIRRLCEHYNGPVPTSKLPSTTITDVGELPSLSLLDHVVIRLFLKILHDPTTPWPVSRAQSTNLVALLAIVADRFAAHAVVAAYLRQQMLDVTLLKDRKSGTEHTSELENRQRLLAGMIFGFPQWVLQCSSALIIGGSKRWRATNLEAIDEEMQDDDALWWRLPGGVEEEIICRREHVLDTFSSIQKHFIALYTSRQPQCKMGYSSSPNCDSYQLGEMIRFFSRKGLLHIESSYFPLSEEEIEPYDGSIEDILIKLRECTAYQIDSHHQHCGLRTRLMPILESLWPMNQVWICLECWRRDKNTESWLENPQGGKWEWRKKSKYTGGCDAHRAAKAMYTAKSRMWTP